MNFSTEVSSDASRPVEASVWINEIASAKSFAKLKTSKSINGSELQSNLEVLDSKIASGLKKIINGDFKRRVFKERNFLSHGQTGGMNDFRVFQGQRHR